GRLRRRLRRRRPGAGPGRQERPGGRRGAPAGGRGQRPPDAHRDLEPPRRRRRQAVPAAAGAARGAARRPDGARRARRRGRRRAHPPRVAVPRRRHGRGRRPPGGAVGEHPLDEHRRDPHRRLPVRPGVRPHGGAGHRGDPPAVAHVRPPRRGPDLRDRRSGRRAGRRRAPPAGAGRQDRCPHRHLGAARRDDGGRSAGGRRDGDPLRRGHRAGLPALRRPHRRPQRDGGVGQDARHRPARGHPDPARPAGARQHRPLARQRAPAG
ncbi:MAG: Solanesyl diphosphate synthase, partial [uncultured Solirubrobacteraceae bacterium]